jgi:hypothetical protein
MRTMVLILLAGVVLGVRTAGAQQLDLAWDVCGAAGGSNMKVLSCADAAAVDGIIVTFTPSVAVGALAGLEAEIEIATWRALADPPPAPPPPPPPPLADYWQFQSGGCNEFGISLSPVPPTGSGAACAAAFPVSVTRYSYFAYPDANGPDRIHIRVWVMGGNRALVAGTEYFAFRLLLNHDNVGTCGGCTDRVGVGISSLTLRDRKCPSGTIAVQTMSTSIRSGLIEANGSPLAVATAPATFSLAGARVNPVVGRDLVVDFTLADASPAWIELLDISGRRVARQEVGSLGPGQHSVRLDEASSARPGVYHLRLANGTQPARVRKTVFLQ